jgi:acetylornithine aminotransferase
MTAAKEVLQIISQPSFLQEVQEKGAYFLRKLQEELQDIDWIIDIRGKGLMIGIVCKGEVSAMVAALEIEGLLVLQAGPNVLRILPPLIVTKEEIDEAVYMMNRVCKQALIK